MRNVVTVLKALPFAFILFASSVNADLVNISNNYLIAESSKMPEAKKTQTSKEDLPQEEGNSKHKKHKHNHKHHEKH